VRTDDFGSRPVPNARTLTRLHARTAHGRWNVRASENDLPSATDSHRGAKELRSSRRTVEVSISFLTRTILRDETQISPGVEIQPDRIFWIFYNF